MIEKLDRSSSTTSEGEQDCELLRRYVKYGSRSAFDALVERHLTFVYSVCMRRLGHRELAEDATQIVFLVLARKAGSLSPRVFLPGWLFQTARLTAMDLRRREARRARYESQALREAVRTLSDRPAVWLDIEPVIDELLARLKTEDRNALLLRFYEERDLADIAMDLGVSEEAARMRISRALRKMRDWLAREGIGVSTATLLSLITSPSCHYHTSVTNMSALTLGASASSHAAIVGKGVAKTMSILKLKAAVVAICSVAAVATVVALTRPDALTPAHRPHLVPYEGRVFDLDGKPVAHAAVFVVQYETTGAIRGIDSPDMQSQHYNRELDATSTDEKGGFSLRDIPEASKSYSSHVEWRCVVMADTGTQVGFATVRPHVKATVNLLPPATVRFHIVDRTGKAVPGVPVVPFSITVRSHSYNFAQAMQCPARWQTASD